MDEKWTTSSRLRLMLLMMVAMTAACPVLDNQCFCHYVDTPRSTRLQFISCTDLGSIVQVPAFKVSREETEMLLVNKNTTIVRLQSHAFAYVKARHLSLRSLNITVVDHLAFGGLEDIIISIDLGNNNISLVPYDTFFRLMRLTTLKLDGNRIAAVDQSTFRGMSQLQQVDLSDNLLRRLPSVVFRDMTNLLILRLQGNSLVTIPEEQLANLRNLEELDLSDNRLTIISSVSFASLSNLKHLSLSGNNVTGTLTSSFLRHLGNITKLNVSRNDISALSMDALRACRQLIVVDLSSNRIRHIEPGSVSALTSLQVLDLNDNSLATLLPSTFHALSDLRRLRLNKNILQSLPAEALIRNSRLEFLDLSFNFIESIPDNLFNVNSSLVLLDLSDNVLVDIGLFLFNVSRLRHLDMSRNFLSELRLSSFVNLANLVYLDVRDNRLVGQLDGRLLSSLPQLEQFMVDGNNVTRIELQRPSRRLVHLTMSSNSLIELPRLLHAPELVLLDVTNNYISVVIDISFSCCQNLRQLHLASNRITSISVNAFHGLTRLSRIDLSNNRLSYMSTGLFESCSALSAVNLSRNLLTAVEVGMLAGPTNLRELDLSWNKLTTLTAGSIHEVFFTLVRLSLAFNPLHCDCRLTWLGAYPTLVDHNTTICCPQQDFRPAVCHYVVCIESRATCPSPSLPVGNSSLCTHTVPRPLIAAVFQLTTTSSPSTHRDTLHMTSLADTCSQAVDVTSPATARHAASTDHVDVCVVVVAVVVPVLGVARCCGGRTCP